MSLDEKACFSERPESRPAKYPCPRCKRVNEYTIRWMRRTKKDRAPQGGDERDRAQFAKLRDHLLRLDDEVTCKTCGKKFEIPSLHSLMFVDQLEGLPKDEEADVCRSDRSPRQADGRNGEGGAPRAFYPAHQRLARIAAIAPLIGFERRSFCGPTDAPARFQATFLSARGSHFIPACPGVGFVHGGEEHRAG